MHIISKIGNTDNVITYEHICDTAADMAAIPPRYITLGSVCIVLGGQSGMEVYMASSDKEWHNLIMAGGSGSAGGGLSLHICTSEEVEEGLPAIEFPLESTLYLVPSGEESGNLYNEFIYINGEWEPFGGASIDLSGYAPINNPVFTGSISLGRKANVPIGNGSVAIGSDVTAATLYSHAEGYQTATYGNYAHAEGQSTKAYGQACHAEGEDTQAYNNDSHAEGAHTRAFESYAHAEGYRTTAAGWQSHAEGQSTYASGDGSHAEGMGGTYTENNQTKNYGALGNYSHSEGYQTTAAEVNSHAEGYQTNASSQNAHAEGETTRASGRSSHAEGLGGDTTIGSGNPTYVAGAFGDYSHSEGYKTRANAQAAHSEGFGGLAYGQASHVEGRSCQALDYYGHAEGSNCIASGYSSHAEGRLTTAGGSCSHAEGRGTITVGDGEHASGWYNALDNVPVWVSGTSYSVGDVVLKDTSEINSLAYTINKTLVYRCETANSDTTFNDAKWEPWQHNLVVVGNGTDESHRSNAYTLDRNGNEWVQGNITAAGGTITIGNTTITEAQLQQLLALLNT